MRLTKIIPFAISGVLLFSCSEKIEEDVLPKIENLQTEQSLFAGANSYIDITQRILETGASKVSIKVDPLKGDVSFDKKNWIKYIPKSSFNSGSDVFEISYLDDANNSLQSESFTFNILTDSTDIPCFNGAMADFYELALGDSLVANVLANDGVCNDLVTDVQLTIVEEPHHGSSFVDSDNNILYQPFLGDSVSTDSLVYSLILTDTEGNLYSSAADVLIQFKEPMGSGIDTMACHFSLNYDFFIIDTDSLQNVATALEPFRLDIFVNDTLCTVSSNELEYTNPLNGTISFSNGEVYYSRNDDFIGDDSFTYYLPRFIESERDSAIVSLIIK